MSEVLCKESNSHVNKIKFARNGNQAVGWKINTSEAYISPKQMAHTSSDFEISDMCSNGVSNWFGWCDGNCGGRDNIGSIETTLRNCGTATLDFGNCYKKFFYFAGKYEKKKYYIPNVSNCKVHVYIDGKLISTALQNTPQKLVTFNFKDGSKLKITDGESGNNACIMMFNNFEIISCSSC